MGIKNRIHISIEASKIGLEESIKIFTKYKLNPLKAVENVYNRLKTLKEENDELKKSK